MDFLKILKSFEEFVYEALLWIILLPRTLVRIVVRPRRMCAYAAAELTRDDDARFNEAMSPPLLLILCILLAHFIDLGVRTQDSVASDTLANVLLGSEQNLLLYRTIAFGVWALAGATYFLIRTGVPIGRDSLRVPFYEQCYLVAPFALVVSVGTSLMLANREEADIAVLATLSAALWFWIAQAGWIARRAQLSLWRAAVAATVILLIGAAINAVVGHALTNVHADVDAGRKTQASK